MLSSAAATNGVQEAERPLQETAIQHPNLFHRWLRLQDFKGETVVISNVVSPEGLLVFRLVVAIYYTAVVVGALVYFKTTFFSFLTCAGSTSLCVYMWVVSYHSFRYCRYKNTDSIDHQHWLLKMGLWLEYISLPCFHSLILLTYWVFLYVGYENSTRFFMWLDLSLHALPLFFISGEVFLARYPFPIRFWFVPVLTLVQYMFLTWFVHAIWHYWVYSFLGLDLRGICMFIGVHIVIGFFFFVWYGIHLLRDRFWVARERLADESVAGGDKAEVTSIL